jgi:GntR family transcriptional regulator/MocR family aminotransferase
VLSPRRRTELIDWAGRGDRLIVEDDYDAELRYDHPPVGALQGLARDRVVYGGTASKVLAPGLRLGWLVVPEALRGAVTQTKTVDDLSAAGAEQHALAELLAAGELERHLRRARRHYADRRQAAVATLARLAPDWTVEGVHAGLHALVRFAGGQEETPLVLEARSRGVNLFGLSWHFADPSRAPAGLVLGYGAVTPAAFDAALRRVVGAPGAQPPT